MLLDTESRAETRRAVGQLVVNRGNLRTQTTEIHGYIGYKPLVLESADFCEKTLAFTQGKHRYQHGSIIFQHLADGIGKARAQRQMAGGVFVKKGVVEEIDEEGNVVNIVSQSWTWRNGDRVCFDNIEVPNTLMSELKAKNAFPEIFEVYAEAARKMIEIDKMTLGKFLQEGKITKEQ